jgi:hypothetical protein
VLGGISLISQSHFGNFGGLRDEKIKQSKPNTPQQMIGSKYRQLMSLVTSAAVQLPLPDEPLPIIRECEKAIQAATYAKTDKEIKQTPSRRCVVTLINALPPNE